jgi:hypothetical protein
MGCYNGIVDGIKCCCGAWFSKDFTPWACENPECQRLFAAKKHMVNGVEKDGLPLPMI